MNFSTGLVTCSICHNPHGDVATKLLRKSAANDLICQQCHTGFYVENPDALLTHPIGYPTLVNPTPTTYADAYAADTTTPKKFKDPLTVPNNQPQGITLISGYVSCSSCHAVHFADSDSATNDGLTSVATLNPGDGHLLKADGPLKANKSVICQTCHTYQRHGNPASLQEDVGCLVCHSGHSYNGGVPNYFVLRKKATTVTFGEKDNAIYTPLTDSFLMNKRDGTGFCERCHGISSAIPYHSLANGGTEDRYLQNCKDCHKHNAAGFDFSWKWSGDSTVCGDCHGFPPYLNVEGDYKDVAAGGADNGTKGGFAVMDNGASDDGHSYATSGYSKSELVTPHKSHAGGGENFGAYTEVTDYKLREGQGACTETCHDLSSHKQVGVTASFRNIVWGPIARGNIAPNAVNLNPVYTTTGNGSCGTVYCHSNGGTRPAGADRAKISADFKFAPANPAWATGDADIIGNATECATFCHGNSTTSMATGAPVTNRNNSVSHIKHLAKGYACNVCHKLTAGVGSTTVVLNTARLAPLGTHVNGKPDVGFDIANDYDPAATGTQLNIVKPASGDAGSGYTATTGVCNVYCHSDGKAIRTYANVDWDQPATAVCGTCHQYYSGGVPTGSGAALSATHVKHMAITLPTAVTCVDCHGANATAGTHTGHVNGAFTFLQSACDSCHGWTSGEKVPVWGETPINDQYCLTCHTGATTGSVKGKIAPTKQHSTTRGHNRTTNYPSGNSPGNKLCTSCHLSTFANHVDGTTGNATGLAAAATTCTATCHGVGGSTVGLNTKGIVTHVSKACTACHDPHGDTTLATNIYMIRSVSTGNYSGSAVDFQGKTLANSYDEDDGAAGNPGEINADDLCATCHTYNSGLTTGHNNKENQPTTASTNHNQGTNCFTSCHKTHKEAGGAFINGPGTECNDCHGNPPLSNAQLKTNGLQYGAHAAHTFVGDQLPAEDRTDCEICHPGAATYSLGHLNGGPLNLDARITSLGSGNYSCGTLNSALGCHASSATDGYWTDVDDAFYLSNGLNCTACHNASGTNDGVLANAAPNSGAHAKHKLVNKTCTDCHNNGVAITDTTHINSFGYAGAADDGLAVTDKAAATQGEGTVLRTGTTYDQVTNFTCSSGIGLACHNSKVTPNWRTFTGITCTNCHNPTTSAAADPKTGLHNIGVTEAAAGVQKHDSTLPGGGCTACHNSTKPPTHANGTFDNDSAVRADRFLNRNGLTWTDNATANRGTCTGTVGLTGCHSDSGNWTRLWSTEANSTVTASGSARCNVCHGQYSTLSGSAGRGWNPGNSHYKTYLAALSPRGATHKSQAGENNACEDCHSYTTLTGNHDTGTHQVTMNDDAVAVIVTEAASRVYCAFCHATGDPLTISTYTFTQSIFPIQRVAGANDPKQECNNCHGDGSGRYWPMSAYGGGRPENDSGRHEIHLTRLTKSKYNMTVVELLADVDVKNKQIELCKYCHNATVPGTNPGHNDTGLPADVAANMYALWDTTRTTADPVTYTGTGANGTGTCALALCHNNKNTNSLGATFYWHASGTQNCTLCHNDIASGATGTTHQAHIGAAEAPYGKTINCGSCHGGSPTWEGDATPNTYAVPATNHIDGSFRIGTDIGAAPGATVSFSYSPNNYADYAAHTFGSCGINLCHNNGKNVAAPAYTWGVTTFIGCAACHATTAAALASSHAPHMDAVTFTSTFRSTVLACTECHDAVSASDMTNKTNHMDGTISWKTAATFAYTGNASVATPNSYGTCSGACHVNHLAAPTASPAWNRTASAVDNCTICHASAPADGRHAKHMAANVNYVGGCGNCHTSATATTITSATHFNGSRNTAGTSSVVYNVGDNTCTNSCHKVSDSRDWTSGGTSPVLFCTDCHQAGTIAATKGALPTSGLHNMTANGVQKHDATLGANGCKECHVTPAGTHLDNNFVVDSGVNNDRFLNTRSGLFWADGATNSGTCWDNGATGAGSLNFAVGCHRDDGVWKRLWSTNANVDSTANPDPGQLVCDVCHGQYQSLNASSKGWREGSVHYRSGGSADENKGASHNTNGGNANACEDCHAYDSAANHQNSAINLSGGAGVPGAYTLTMGTSGWYCASCHNTRSAEVATLTTSHTFPDSTAFTTRTYVVGVSQPQAGGCGSCHDDNVIPPNSGAHVAHGADSDSDYSECEACHGTNNGGNWATGSGGTHNTGSVNFAAGITYNNGGTPGTNAAAANDTCSTTQCHSKSTEVATWGTPASLGCDECHNATATVVANNAGRTLSPSHNTHFAKGKTCTQCHTVLANRTHISAGAGTDGFILTGRANAAQDEAIVTMTLAAINGSNSCSGTTGIGVGCHNTKATPAWGTTGIGCSNCHVPGGGAAADPASGLHNMTANNVQPHNATLRNGCTECHAAMTSDPATHIDGVWEADANNNMIGGQPRFLSGTRTALAYSEGAANSSTCWDTGVINTTTGLDYSGGIAPGCHRDDGKWKRLWSTNANVDSTANPDPGQLVCDVCHGQYQSLNASSKGWREGSVHYRSGGSADENKGVSHNKNAGNANACEDCHAYDSAANHQNSAINLSGGAGVPGIFTLTMGTSGWYCATCHNAGSAEVATLTTSHTFPDSTAFTTRTYVVGVSQPVGGACDQCHGYPPLPSGYVVAVGDYEKGKPENYPGGGSGHAIVKHLAKNILPANGWTPCSPCHYNDAINHNTGGDVTDRDGVDNIPDTIDDSIQVEIDPARDYKVPALYQKVVPVQGMGQCKNLNCHFTESPKWDCTP